MDYRKRLIVGGAAGAAIVAASAYVLLTPASPEGLQILSAASPTCYYMQIALATLLKGVGWTAMWPQLIALAAISLALVAAGWARLARGGTLGTNA